jgi:tetratricopeptide (TPR) repeat protein
MVGYAAGRRWRERGIVRAALTRGAAALFIAIAGAAGAADNEPQCGSVTGNPQLAIQVCTRAIEFMSLNRPDLAKAYYSRGAEWTSQGNHDRAIPDYNMAIELDPKHFSAYYNRALAWSAKGESDRAIADYDAAIKLNPRDASAWLGRGAESIAKGDYRRAIADYEEALRVNSESAQGYFGRGRARLYAGDFMMAASDLYRAHDLEPGMYSALWLFLARKRADIPGERTLAREAGTTGGGAWPAPVVALYLGSANPEAVNRAAVHADPARQRDLRCEASFYIGQWHVLRGASDAALPLFREAESLCARSFIEREGAVAELRRPR